MPFAAASSSVAPISGSVIRNEMVYPLRVQAMTKMARLSYVLVTMGIMCVAVGIPILVYLDSDANLFISNGPQIWSGAFMTILGVLGIITSRTSQNLKHDIQFNLKCKIGLFYGLSVSSTSICGMAGGFTGISIGLCANQACATGNNSVVLALLAISLAIIVLMLLCGVFGMVFFCWYRNVFQMYSPGYRENLLQQQVNILRIQQANSQQQNDWQ